MFASNPPLKYGASPRNSKSNNFLRRANTFSAFCSLSVSRIRRIDSGTIHATLARRVSMSATGHEHASRMPGRDGASASVTGRNRGSAANWKSVPETDIIDLFAMADRLVGTRRVPAVERAFRAGKQGDRVVGAREGSLGVSPLPSRWRGAGTNSRVR